MAIETRPISDTDRRIAGRTGFSPIPRPQAIEGVHSFGDAAVSSTLRTERAPMTRAQRAAIDLATDLSQQLHASGSAPQILRLFHDSVLPGEEFLTYGEIYDRVAQDPDNNLPSEDVRKPHSEGVKRLAIRMVIEEELPKEVKDEIVSIRDGAVALRTLGNVTPEEWRIRNSKGSRSANKAASIVEGLGRTRWTEAEKSALAATAEDPRFHNTGGRRNWIKISRYLNRLLGIDRKAKTYNYYHDKVILPAKKLKTAA